MPGRHLSSNEQKLLKLWQSPPNNLPRPTLRSIEVSPRIDQTDSEVLPRTGIRGIDRLIVPFRYPITALCGNNGVGKSTILALAALAHHSPPGWFVHLNNTGPSRAHGDRRYYTFSDFFAYAPGEVPPRNVEVTWRYYYEGQEVSLSFTKTDRWGRYTKRPEREVDFLSVGRILPAHEMTGVLSTFRKQGEGIQSTLLSEEFTRTLSSIMGREYTLAEIQRNRRYTFHRCRTDTAYSAFNMGGGESSVISLLYLLHRMPRGGLLVVEEIEAGLHPQAQVRLAQALIKTYLDKQIQVICSTHSESFLDALPRQARLLMRRMGEDHTVLESPSTRFAVYEMTGEFQPELVVYCEDVFAATMVQEALPHDLRIRLRVQDVGSNATVIRQGVSHLRSGLGVKALCVLDGDCSTSDIEGWIRSEIQGRDDIGNLQYVRLPGDGMPPEVWATEQINLQPYQAEFAKQLGCSMADTQVYIEAMKVELDPHNINYRLHCLTTLDPLDCMRRVIRSFAAQHPQLEGLRSAVSSALN